MIPCDFRGEQIDSIKCKTCHSREWPVLACSKLSECVPSGLSTKAKKQYPERAEIQACDSCPSRTVQGALVGVPSVEEIRAERIKEAKQAAQDNPRVSEARKQREEAKKISKIPASSPDADFKICRSQLAEDESETNPSIVKWKGYHFMAYEQRPGPNLYFAELNAGWEPNDPDSCRLINSRTLPENIAGRELPKLFVHQGGLWITYTGISRSGQRTPIIGRLNSFGEVDYETPVLFHGATSQEKGWVMWESEAGIMSSYCLSPHVALKISGMNATVDAVSGWDCPYEKISSAGSPVLVDDLWYCWISVMNSGIDSLHLIAWENRSPWRVVKRTKRAMLVPSEKWLAPTMIVGGAVFRGGMWRVGLGSGGNECRIVTFDQKRVESELVSIAT